MYMLLTYTLFISLALILFFGNGLPTNKKAEKSNKPGI